MKFWEKIKDKNKKSLAVPLLIVAVLFVVTLTPIVYSCRYMLDFMDYKNRIQNSFYYSVTDGSATCIKDGKQSKLSNRELSDLHVAIVTSGIGKVLKEEPETEEVTEIDFGDGSTMVLRPAVIEDPFKSDPMDGAFIKYTDKKGTYMYENEKINYRIIVRNY